MPSNATETIDARILRLIGLEDTFDLDYDTYLTLLNVLFTSFRTFENLSLYTLFLPKIT